MPIANGAAPSEHGEDADQSQNGEVAELRQLLKPGFPEWIADIGAYDGVKLSNSRPFVLEGWRALMVEPHPTLFASLQATYRDNQNVHCLNRASSDAAGTLPLFLGTDPGTMMSTLSTDDNPWTRIARADASVPIAVETATALLEQAGFPKDFSILLVDCEGMDYEVLKGLDFERYRPRIIVTEEYLFNPDKHNAKYRLLLDRGYTFYKMVGCNTLWIANEWVATSLNLT